MCDPWWSYMVDHNGDPRTPTDSERTVKGNESVKNGWSRTLQDMEMMAEDRKDRGFETVTIPATDTTPKSPKSGETSEFGLSFLIPDNKADRFLELFGGEELTDTGVYQTTNGGHVFIVTELINLHTESVALVAGTYKMRNATGLVKAAKSEATMYTYFRSLDGTRLAAFEHDDASEFFPNSDEFSAYR